MTAKVIDPTMISPKEMVQKETCPKAPLYNMWIAKMTSMKSSVKLLSLNTRPTGKKWKWGMMGDV